MIRRLDFAGPPSIAPVRSSRWPTHRRGVRSFAVALLLTDLIAAAPGSGAIITVGPGCTLIEAIQAANNDSAVGGCAAGSGADIIALPFGTHALTDAHGGTDNGLPPITSAVTIMGHGSTIVRSLGSAPPLFRFFQVDAGGHLTLRDLTLQGGRIATADARGGAIRVNDGAGLTLDTVTVRGNSLAAGLDGTASGAGIYVGTGGRLAMRDSRIVANEAVVVPNPGSGITALALGGGIFLGSDAADTVIADSIVADNALLADQSDSTRASGTGRGAGIFVDSAKALTLVGSRVTGNRISADRPNSGAGMVEGAGLFKSGNGDLTIFRSVISHNSASAKGTLDPPAPGGGSGTVVGTGGTILGVGVSARTDGAVTVADTSINHNAGVTQGGSLFSGTLALDAGYARGGGLHYAGRGLLVLERVSVSHNALTALSSPVKPGATVTGVGIRIGSATIGGTPSDPYEARLTSVTVANNAGVATSPAPSLGSGVGQGAGILMQGNGTVTVLNSTIVGNSLSGDSSLEGGGLRNTLDTSATLLLRYTILQGNTAASGPDCAKAGAAVGYASLGNNLVGTLDGCDLALGPTDRLGVDPGLGPFTDDDSPGGGYFPPTPGGAAVDAGDDANCAPADQLGQGRSGACDIGAIQMVPAGVPLLAAVLPVGRAGQLGEGTLTAFDTVINVGSATAYRVGIAQGPAPVPATFHFQTTDPGTNALAGSADAPIDIPPGEFRTFVFALRPTEAFPPTDFALSFAGTNTLPVATNAGLNTLLVSASVTPVADIIALGLTPSGDGIVKIPGPTGTGLFTIATTNLGAPATITLRTATGATSPAPAVFVCQTDAAAQCLSPLAPTVTTVIGTNETPTFAVFLAGNGAIALDPANHRLIATFEDESGLVRGATGAAIQTE